MDEYIKDRLRFKDTKLNIDELDEYTLNLYLSKYEFAFSVYNSKDNRCLRLESFVFPTSLEFGKNEEILLKIFEDNHLLPAAFWKKIQLFVAGTDYTFIPKTLFSSDHQEKLLEFNCSVNLENYQVFNKGFSEMHLIYGVENEIINFIKKIYPSREVEIHSFLSNILPKGVHEHADEVYAFLDQGLITVYARKNNKFSYCNTSHFKNIDDALYYIMMVYNELNLNPENVPLKISGNSDSLTLLKSRIFKYVNHVDLGSKPAGLKLCYEFDSLEEGRFFGLLNATL